VSGVKKGLNLVNGPCVDVHFQANCSGSTEIFEGKIGNMVGMGTGCFGDTQEIKPKLSCNSKDIEVRISEVTTCGK
jgi:hypothetical protein